MPELARARLAVDVGGTFTDVALEIGTDRTTSKVLTTPRLKKACWPAWNSRLRKQGSI